MSVTSVGRGGIQISTLRLQHSLSDRVSQYEKTFHVHMRLGLLLKRTAMIAILIADYIQLISENKHYFMIIIIFNEI
jgi:hypothetical protein